MKLITTRVFPVQSEIRFKQSQSNPHFSIPTHRFSYLSSLGYYLLTLLLVFLPSLNAHRLGNQWHQGRAVAW
ncbi:hypothetical protein FKM82_016942 [Ascaphus truei]